MIRPFNERLQPAVNRPVFERDDHYVWCPSVIHDDAGRFHLFASTWPKPLPFMRSYPLNSHVVRAEADHPEGPFVLKDVVLDDRGETFWDGRATHNPQIHRVGKKLALFYIGTTYPGPHPTMAEEVEAAEDRRPERSHLDHRRSPGLTFRAERHARKHAALREKSASKNCRASCLRDGRSPIPENKKSEEFLSDLHALVLIPLPRIIPRKPLTDNGQTAILLLDVVP